MKLTNLFQELFSVIECLESEVNINFKKNNERGISFSQSVIIVRENSKKYNSNLEIFVHSEDDKYKIVKNA